MEMLNNADSANSANIKFSPLLFDCRFLISRFTQVRVAYVYREVNKCADFFG